MNTLSQQALAAFIDSGNLEFRKKTGNGWQESMAPAEFWVSQGYEVALIEGQLNEFGIPHSLAHLIHNPAGLPAEQITEGGKYRCCINGEFPIVQFQYWRSPSYGWCDHPPCEKGKLLYGAAEGKTYRLPALHPLPKVKCVRYDHDGVHASHCCKDHGCKYGETDCPVVLGRVLQEYPCEDCTPPQAEVKQSERKDLESILLGHFILHFPKLAWTDGWTTADLMSAEIIALKSELTAERKRAEDAEAQNVVLREALELATRSIQNWCDSVDKDASWDGWDSDFKDCKWEVLPALKQALSAQPPAVKEETS